MIDMKIKVGLSDDFLNSLTKIQKKQQSKVLSFVNKFRTEPTSSGINYEKINNARSNYLYSVRIDLTYRAIIFKPDKGNIYILLWVDHHDEAYAWAERKQIKIHPNTGTLQVYEAVTEEEVVKENLIENTSNSTGHLSPFAELRDRQLLRLGVPEEMLSLVKKISSEKELDNFNKILPAEAYESLFYILAGDTYENALANVSSASESEKEKIDIEDYSSALNKSETRRKIYVVENETELTRILNSPLEKWRVFLHPLQRKLIERNWNGPVRVLGGAGTGKTVCAIHRAKWLVTQIFTEPNDRVLFTTYTRNLAEDIKENLRTICTPEIMKKIEVVNLDRWILNFLKQRDYNYSIDYGTRCKELWNKALDLIPGELDLRESFYREEWERVVQPQGIESLPHYMRASRIGRGVRLSAKQRKAIWTVFEEYRALLEENHLRESEDALRDARAILTSDEIQLPYKAVIVDEAQDMGVQAFKLIRALVPENNDDIFIVGDAHQRIYRHKVVLGRCGIKIVGRSKKLKINYRTTDETRKWAESLLYGIEFDDLDGGTDNNKGYKSLMHGIEPIIKPCRSIKEETDFILKYIESVFEQEQQYKGICIVSRTNDLLKEYEGILKYNNIPCYFVKRDGPEDRSKEGIRLATMHRVKGLEFDRVIICGVHEGKVPLKIKNTISDDLTVSNDHESHERSLMYVSATRARKEVVVTCHGKLSRFIKCE